MPVTCPALLVAAPASGQGKSTVVAALARLCVRRGLNVRVFKCGPDHVDPLWHELASGAPVHNLDLWMCGADDVRRRLHAAAQVADVVLVEGVMGLHDGRPSSADLARRLGLPVLLVVRADAMAQTVGALEHGLRTWRQEQHGLLPWAGVLANGVATDGHAQLLREAMEQPESWLGHLPFQETMRVPERHLGLVAAQDLDPGEAMGRLDAAVDALADTPLGRMTLDDWRARWSVTWDAPEPAVLPSSLLAGRTIAVARDAAFAFIYPANIETLEGLGARLVFFSPLAGHDLPECDALWLPGGYPELHAESLAGQAVLRGQLQQHVAAGKPVWAEGGGLLSVLGSLVAVDGREYKMWGLLPGQGRMQSRLAGLGMQSWPDVRGVVPGLRGHSFHYGLVETDAAAEACTEMARTSARVGGEPIYIHNSVRGSFFHPWMASSPQAAAQLFLP